MTLNVIGTYIATADDGETVEIVEKQDDITIQVMDGFKKPAPFFTSKDGSVVYKKVDASTFKAVPGYKQYKLSE